MRSTYPHRVFALDLIWLYDTISNFHKYRREQKDDCNKRILLFAELVQGHQSPKGILPVKIEPEDTPAQLLDNTLCPESVQQSLKGGR